MVGRTHQAEQPLLMAAFYIAQPRNSLFRRAPAPVRRQQLACAAGGRRQARPQQAEFCSRIDERSAAVRWPGAAEMGEMGASARATC